MKKPKVILSCKQCSTDFGVIPSLAKTAKYCSLHCKNIGIGLSQIGNTFNLGRVHSKEVKEANRQRNLGKKLSKEHRDKISASHMGKIGHPSWNKGKKHPAVAGEKNNNWKGGITPYYRILRVARLRAVGGSHTIQEWRDLKKFYNYICLCCKQQEPFITLSKDHVIPVVMGGSNAISNIQPLCVSCNSRKNIKVIDYKLTYNPHGI